MPKSRQASNVIDTEAVVANHTNKKITKAKNKKAMASKRKTEIDASSSESEYQLATDTASSESEYQIEVENQRSSKKNLGNFSLHTGYKCVVKGTKGVLYDPDIHSKLGYDELENHVYAMRGPVRVIVLQHTARLYKENDVGKNYIWMTRNEFGNFKQTLNRRANANKSFHVTKVLSGTSIPYDDNLIDHREQPYEKISEKVMELRKEIDKVNRKLIELRQLEEVSNNIENNRELAQQQHIDPTPILTLDPHQDANLNIVSIGNSLVEDDNDNAATTNGYGTIEDDIDELLVKYLYAEPDNETSSPEVNQVIDDIPSGYAKSRNILFHHAQSSSTIDFAACNTSLRGVANTSFRKTNTEN